MSGSGPLRPWAAGLPYVAVLIGMGAFSSAWLTFAIYHGGILVLLASQRDRETVGRLLRGVTWSHAVALALLGGLAGLSLHLLWPWLGIGGELSAQLANFGLSGAAWPAFALYHFTVNPPLEEMFWRGALRRDTRALTPEDVLFAGYHLLVLRYFVEWPWLLAVLAVLSATAWLWRQLSPGGALALPWISHAAADLSVMAVAWHHAGVGP